MKMSERSMEEELLDFGSKTVLGRWREEKRQPKQVGDTKRKSMSKEKQNVLRTNKNKKKKAK